MTQKTPLYHKHIEADGKMVDFAGWSMPIHYGSQLEEHKQVRCEAGVFDVSHMTIVDVEGADAEPYLRRLLANDVARLDVLGRALYSGMLNENGGVIDDLIVYRMAFGFRVVSNCATREKDLAWMRSIAGSFILEINERPDLSILAVHGPASIDRVCKLLDSDSAEAVRNLGNFRGQMLDQWFIARTGYTGEKGLEIILPDKDVAGLWDQLLSHGVNPIGLGARDTLRLEAGMNLYGHDMDESISPIAANMAFSIAWDPLERDFVGRKAITAHLEQQRQGHFPELAGLVLEQRGVLREGQRVITENGDGIITSGSFSPTLKHSIALARIPVNSENCQVEMRGKLVAVRKVRPNFVRFGKKVFE